jgi:hypothetical protein
MSPERKAEVNRRLAEFEGFEGILDDSPLLAFMGGNDYTADLNALTRLAAKLPAHAWAINYRLRRGEDGRVLADLWIREPDLPSASILANTEAEARAEAICQYLESR